MPEEIVAIGLEEALALFDAYMAETDAAKREALWLEAERYCRERGFSL